VARFTTHIIPTAQYLADARARVADLQAQLDAAKARLAEIEASLPAGKLAHSAGTAPKPKKK